MPAGGGGYTALKTSEESISIKTTKNAGQMAGVLISIRNKSG